MNRDAVLPTIRLEPGTALAQAEPWSVEAVTVDSPALAVVTDLARVKAATTQPATLLRQAEQMMIYLGVRMLFVVTDMPSVEGLVTTTDLHGDRQVRAAHDRQLRWDELTVADVMTPFAELEAVPYETMRKACVGDVVATLQRWGRNHLLVVEQATPGTPRRIRGVISRSQIERQLGRPIDVMPIATSFAEIERALA